MKKLTLGLVALAFSQMSFANYCPTLEQNYDLAQLKDWGNNNNVPSVQISDFYKTPTARELSEMAPYAIKCIETFQKLYPEHSKRLDTVTFYGEGRDDAFSIDDFENGTYGLLFNYRTVPDVTSCVNLLISGVINRRRIKGDEVITSRVVENEACLKLKVDLALYDLTIWGLENGLIDVGVTTYKTPDKEELNRMIPSVKECVETFKTKHPTSAHKLDTLILYGYGRDNAFSINDYENGTYGLDFNYRDQPNVADCVQTLENSLL